VEGLAASGAHALVTCEGYAGGAVSAADGPPLTEAPQPYELKIHPDVAFLCDLHAHLADAEIIGLLGGRWDPARNAMHVQAPFPCRAVGRDDDGATDVEMDPASELSVREVPCVESQPIQDTFNVSVPERIFKGISLRASGIYGEPRTGRSQGTAGNEFDLTAVEIFEEFLKYPRNRWSDSTQARSSRRTRWTSSGGTTRTRASSPSRP